MVVEADIPDETDFAAKPRLAQAMISRAIEAGVLCRFRGRVVESAGPLRNPDVLEFLSDPLPEVLRFTGLTIERFIESADAGGPEAAADVAQELMRVIR